MALTDLEQDVARRLGFASTAAGITDSTTQARIRAYINETQQELLSEPGAENLLDDSVTFASVASTPEYSLPPVVSRIIDIRETTNRTKLGIKDNDWYRTLYPDPTAITGIATDWVDLGFVPVETQPTAAAELFVKSSDNASDLGGTKKAYIEGYVTGGFFRSANVAVNGTTAVSFGATITTWIEITKFYLDFTPAGNITINQGSGAGTELSKIGIGQTYARFRRIALVVCPSSAITYTVEFERDVTDMSVANDQPVLPPRFHRLLAVGARVKEYEKQQDTVRYQLALAEYERGKRKYKYWLHSQSVGTPNLTGLENQQPSRLGAWFPAGS